MNDLVGIGKALEPFSDGTVGLLRRLFGAASTELGEVLADRVRAYRSKNLASVLAPIDADPPKSAVVELPLRFAIPFVEHASREDDELLQEMWSTLLRDAAYGVDEEHHLVLSVLKSITPKSAMLLREMVGTMIFHHHETINNFIQTSRDGWIEKFDEFLDEAIDEFGPPTFDAEGKLSPLLINRIFEFKSDYGSKVFAVDTPTFMPTAEDKTKYWKVVLPTSRIGAPLQILEREMLVELSNFTLEKGFGIFKIHIATPTRLGLKLIDLCTSQNEKQSAFQQQREEGR